MRVNCAYFHRTSFVTRASSEPSSASSKESSKEATLMEAGVPDPGAALEDDSICSKKIDAENLEEVGEEDERDENVNSSTKQVSVADFDPHIMLATLALDAAPPWTHEIETMCPRTESKKQKLLRERKRKMESAVRHSLI